MLLHDVTLLSIDTFVYSYNAKHLRKTRTTIRIILSNRDRRPLQWGGTYYKDRVIAIPSPNGIYLLFIWCWSSVLSAVLQEGLCCWFSSFASLDLSSGPLCFPSYVYSFLVRGCSFLKYISFFTDAASTFFLFVDINIFGLNWCSEHCSAKGSMLPVPIFCAPRPQ